jgi:hypothetical protein
LRIPHGRADADMLPRGGSGVGVRGAAHADARGAPLEPRSNLWAALLARILWKPGPRMGLLGVPRRQVFPLSSPRGSADADHRLDHRGGFHSPYPRPLEHLGEPTHPPRIASARGPPDGKGDFDTREGDAFALSEPLPETQPGERSAPSHSAPFCPSRPLDRQRWTRVRAKHCYLCAPHSHPETGQGEPKRPLPVPAAVAPSPPGPVWPGNMRCETALNVLSFALHDVQQLGSHAHAKD